MFETLDSFLLILINKKLVHPNLDLFFTFITSAKLWIWLFMIFLGCCFLSRKKPLIRYATIMLSTMALCDLFTSQVLKPYYKRPRPCHASAEVRRVDDRCGAPFGMPSNHASNGFSAAFFTFFWRKTDRNTFFAFIIAALVSYSRIYLGAHYPTDILAGILVGFFFGGTSCLLFKKNRIEE